MPPGKWPRKFDLRLVCVDPGKGASDRQGDDLASSSWACSTASFTSTPLSSIDFMDRFGSIGDSTIGSEALVKPGSGRLSLGNSDAYQLQASNAALNPCRRLSWHGKTSRVAGDPKRESRIWPRDCRRYRRGCTIRQAAKSHISLETRWRGERIDSNTVRFKSVTTVTTSYVSRLTLVEEGIILVCIALMVLALLRGGPKRIHLLLWGFILLPVRDVLFHLLHSLDYHAGAFGDVGCQLPEHRGMATDRWILLHARCQIICRQRPAAESAYGRSASG